jgi:peptidylprolyl isomerase
VRTLPALIVAVGLVASLAACSSSESTRADCSTAPVSGDASESVTATGDFGSKTVVDFPTPLIAKKLQVTEVESGDGDALTEGDFADFQATIWNAATGEYVTGTTFTADQPSRMLVGADADQLGPILECATVGSRVVGVSTLAQLFGDVDASADGLEADSNLVVVIDVTGGFGGKADGVDQLPKAGFPSVVTATDGTPGITIPNEDAPTTLESAVLKQGDGDTVKKGDYVTLQYSTFGWATPGIEGASSWADNAPTTVIAQAFNPESTAGLFPGTEDAIIGQKVGSQVIVIVPADKSYAAGTATDTIADGSTRIYVIDILNTQVIE